jgi:hypothetical protein
MHDQLIEGIVQEVREIGRTTCDGQLAGYVPGQHELHVDEARPAFPFALRALG